MESKVLKIKSIKPVGIKKVNDLTVENVNHYISENGIINHNSGPAYAASIIIFLSKAQLKEGDSKNGIIITATTEKNRFARPEKIKFHIHYKKGMNAYIGLHEYLSWDNCGIENGKIINEEAFTKLDDKFGSKDSKLFKIIHNTEYEVAGNKFYFIDITGMKKLKMAGIKKFAVKHLCTEVDVNELFTERVFTEETLKQLDDTVIRETFSYGITNVDSFEEIFSEELSSEEVDKDNIFD